MTDFAVSVRLRGDASELVGQVGAAKKAVDGLSKAERDSANAAQQATRAQADYSRVAKAVQVAVQQQQAALRTNQRAFSQLGLQLNDVTVQAAAGTSAFQIFAQQSNQVAFALSGFSGALGRVGTFLSGPWGAAITGAVIALGALYTATRDNTDAEKEHEDAAKELADALKDLATQSGLTRKSAEEEFRATVALIEAKQQDIIKTREQTKARLEFLLQEQRAKKIISQGFGTRGETAALGIAVQDNQIAGLQALLDQQNKSIAATQKQIDTNTIYFNSTRAAAAATSATAAAQQRYEREVEKVRQEVDAGRLSQDEATKRLTAAQRALDAVKESQQSTASATRSATTAISAQAKELDSLTQAAVKAANAVGLTRGDKGFDVGEIFRQQDADAAKSRQDSGLGAIADAAGERLADKADEAGSRFGKQVDNAALSFSDALGRVIGGKSGSKIGGFISLLGGDSKTSPFGKAFSEGFKQPFDKLSSSLGNIFSSKGGQAFAKTAGTAFAGAQTGSVVAGITKALGIKTSSTGAQIGGSIGALTGIPGGDIIGSIIGGVVGGLFKKTKKGSAQITFADGIAGVGSAVGNSSSRKQAATALGGSISDAINSIAEALGAGIGTARVSVGQRGKKFVVDTTGQNRTKGAGVQKFKTAEEAQAAALADAIKDGVFTGLSAAVQAALQSGGSDVERGVKEALKVQQLEDALDSVGSAARKTFRDFETQAKDRLRIAKKYGFDIVKVEELNAKQRKELLDEVSKDTVGSLQQLLDDLKFGALSSGTILDRRANLQTEIDKLGNAQTPDEVNKLSDLLRQFIDTSEEAFGTAGQFGSDRSSVIARAQAVIEAAQARIAAEAKAAQDATIATAANTAEANNQLAVNNALLRRLVEGQGAGFGGIGANSGFNGAFGGAAFTGVPLRQAFGAF